MILAAPRRWLQRHAQPLIAQGVCYGQLDISAHIEATQEAAMQMSRYLLQQSQRQPGMSIEIISSPLVRCVQLANAVQEQLHVADLAATLTKDGRLMEMDFGTWEGQPWDTVSVDEWNAWLADFAHYPVGSHGESVAQLMDRVQQFVQEHQACGNHWQLWVTHAGVIKAMELLSQGLTAQCVQTARQWPGSSCSYGKWLACPLLASQS